jgi:NAD(P)-dependent dehydrogenase (short-subunit alcohol dehydrogenase family)
MNQVVVMTGCADGMGRQVVEKLAAQGCSIAGFDVDGAWIASLEKELGEIGGEHLLDTIDITDRGRIRAFRDRVLAKFGRVDTVLSNVGIGFFSPFEEADLDAALRCLDINVIGAAAIFQAFLPSMRERRKGRLIAMSSLVGRIPFPFESIYTASKFAITGLMLSIRLEVQPFGIEVGIIEPAQVATRFAAKIHVLPPESSPYRERARRFIERDNELIQTAPSPGYAGDRIVKVVLAPKIRLFNQIDFMSSFFLWINQILPRRIRDAILVNYMNIKMS